MDSLLTSPFQKYSITKPILLESKENFAFENDNWESICLANLLNGIDPPQTDDPVSFFVQETSAQWNNFPTGWKADAATNQSYHPPIN